MLVRPGSNASSSFSPFNRLNRYLNSMRIGKLPLGVLAQGRITDCKSKGKQFSSNILEIFENSGQFYGTITIIIYDFKQVYCQLVAIPFSLKYYTGYV